jgi:hypothetical protein
VTIAPALVRISYHFIYGEIWLQQRSLGISVASFTAKENSDKYRQEKEAIKVDFIRWVLI